MEDNSTKSFLGWRMVAIALTVDFFAVGFSFQSYPVIQLVVEKELGLTRLMTTSIIQMALCSMQKGLSTISLLMKMFTG